MLPLLLASAAVYMFGWIIYARWFHPCAKYPGPFLASISRLWYLRVFIRAKTVETQRELHRKFGPIVRIAPDEVIIADPSAVKTIYGLNSGFTKTEFYTTYRTPWVRYPDLFTCIDDRVHASRRRIVNHVYSMSSVARSEQSIDACTREFVDRMTENFKKGQAVDLSVWTRWYGFDVIGELFFSRQFGFLKESEDHQGWIHANDILVPVLTTWAIMPPWTRPLLKLTSLAMPRLLNALMSMKTFDVAANKCIEERRALLEKTGGVLEKEDMLASLFKIMETRGKELDYTSVEIKSEIYIAMVAGFDTVATAMTGILYYLMKTPSAYHKLRDEIDTATSNGQLSTPYVVYNEAAKLPYLDACIKEGLRIHPSVGLSLPRHVPPGGREIAGQFFPAGVTVGINAVIMQRDKRVFGEDADEFKPERWFRPEAVEMNRHMLHFGGGAYSCIGKNIALSEMYKLIPELIRSFDFELVDPKKGCDFHSSFFYQQQNVFTRFTPRATKVAT